MEQSQVDLLAQGSDYETFLRAEQHEEEGL